MLVDIGAVVNIMPYSVQHRLGRSTGDLIKTNVTLSDFNGQTSEASGILSVDLTVGNKTVPTSFFIVKSKSTYNVLLGRDWIHANCCIPSIMHQYLIQCANPRDQPQKMKCKLLMASVLHDNSSYREARSSSRCRCLTGCPPRDIPKVVSFG
jgi:hypothetical protein